MAVRSLVLAATCVLCCAANAQTTRTWNGSAGPNWHVASNWTPSGIPAATDDVVIANVATTPSAFVSAPACRNLTLNASARLTLGGTALTCSGNVLLNASARLDLGGATVSVGGNWTSSAAGAQVLAPGTVAFTGLGATGAGANVLPDVVVSAGTRRFNTTRIAGSYTQSGGDCVLNSGATLTIDGAAQFQAGTVGAAGAGTQTIVLNGPTVMAAAPNASFAQLTIRCASDWASGPAFVPPTGTVRFEGAGPAQISGTLDLFTVDIQQGTKTVQSPLHAHGGLTVTSGTLVAAAPLDIDGSLTVQAGATLDLGGQAHHVGGSWISNSATATVVGAGSVEFDGSGTTFTGTTELPAVTVSAGVRNWNRSTISGDLTQTGGQSLLLANVTLAVHGNANFSGGTLGAGGASPAVLDVDGNVQMLAAAASSIGMITIQCGGDWTSNAAFAPSAGKVVLDGAAPTHILGAAPTFDPTFATLLSQNAQRTAGNSFTMSVQSATFDTGSGLDVGTQAVGIAGGPVVMDGLLNVGAGGVLGLAPDASLLVSGPGSLRLAGAPGAPARIAGINGGGYALTIAGTLAAHDFVVSDAGPAGMVVALGATIAPPPDDLTHGAFTHPSPVAGSTLLDIQRPDPATFQFLSFDDAPLAGTFNVRCGGGAPITFQNWSGGMGGAAYSDDPGALITWGDQAVTILDSFTATPACGQATLAWQTIQEIDIQAFILERDTGSGWTGVTEVAPHGAAPYTFVDSNLASGSTIAWRLSERVAHAAIVVLGTVSAMTPPDQLWYADQDGDGFGDPARSLLACNQPLGYVAQSGDCNDGSAAVHPGAVETCNGIDDNCDGRIDEGLTQIWYADQDGDGYGNPASTIIACVQPPGYVAIAGDCDDHDAAVHPGAPEVCNGKDDNCNGQIDEGLPTTTWYADADGDGFGTPAVTLHSCLQPTGYVAQAGDCNDGSAAVHPGAVELCNGIDDNCDGHVDEGVGQTWYADQDGDGFGNAAIIQIACAQPVGYVAQGGDCNDANPAVHPGAIELCNGLDDNCDGHVDEGAGQVWYADQDGDGYGNAAITKVACTQPAGYVAPAGDCNDANAAVHPGAVELANGIDDDCNGLIDEGLLQTWYADLDGDGYGDAANNLQAAVQPAGYVPIAGDCDDSNPAVNPLAVEICNGIDDDCDGQVDEGCVSNDACLRATPVTDGVFNGNTSAAAQGPPIPGLCTPATRGVWYSYQFAGTCARRVKVSLATEDQCHAHFPAVIAAFDGTCGALTPLACATKRRGQARIAFNAQPQHVYRIAVLIEGTEGGGAFRMRIRSESAHADPVGSGCPRASTVLETSEPEIGEHVSLSIRGADRSATGILWLGLPRDMPGTLPGGCPLFFVQPQAQSLAVVTCNAAGRWSSSKRLRNDPSLECGVVVLQAILLGPSGVHVTNGVRWTIGHD